MYYYLVADTQQGLRESIPVQSLWYNKEFGTYSLEVTSKTLEFPNDSIFAIHGGPNNLATS